MEGILGLSDKCNRVKGKRAYASGKLGECNAKSHLGKQVILKCLTNASTLYLNSPFCTVTVSGNLC